MREIKHQQQTHPHGCVSACLAMLTDQPVEKVTEEFNDLYHDHKIQPHDYLDQHGIRAIPGITIDNTLHDGRTYMIAAPSLNIEGKLHALIADLRDGFKLYDPNMGRGGRRWYVWKPEEDLQPGEFNICGWVIDYEVWIK